MLITDMGYHGEGADLQVIKSSVWAVSISAQFHSS